ncbi:MAG: hypothetical protein GX362_05835 [Methanosarcinaceae archaeon]|nr:hypothetical protein [Methanosarcinaceae archaeon]
MVTKLCLTNICGHVSTVTAEVGDDGMTTIVNIDTTCEKIKKWGTTFTFPMENMMTPCNTTFQENEKNGKLTPTCFIPTVILNAVWIENGMMSKNLAQKEGVANIECLE